MEVLRDTGFFDEEPLTLRGGRRVTPREVTERLLFRAWKRRGDEEEFTYLKVEVTGRRPGGNVRMTFELLDRTDRASGTTSMARTTAFPCAAVARLLARGEYRDPGVRPLEMVAADRSAAARFEEILSARGLRWQSRTEEIDIDAAQP